MASDPGARVPQFGLCPPVRCYECTSSSPLQICGKPAGWKRPGSHLFNTSFFCDEHRCEGDVQLGAIGVVHRLRISGDALFTAASHDHSQARAEALGRLEDAVARAGGLLDLRGIHVSMGRYGW